MIEIPGNEPDENPELILIARLMIWMMINTVDFTRELTPEQIQEKWEIFHR